ncbi:hypothetical protein Sfum_2045 [Syntrophobacter fumaroxidans MPOB]|uniref:Uncharacterized protein n=1 Tax=Syntrophobacter fumaroxidans (strain DSM 10017 / MPOB) TaxID=335543 RepID=A0LJX6_SYNFM|nr:hypothetical protein Sfum_2045 [Syntrophobacter fumaroxidans MPOB]
MPNDSAWQYFKPFRRRFQNNFCRRRADLTGFGGRFEMMECPAPGIEKTALQKKDLPDAAFSVIRGRIGRFGGESLRAPCSVDGHIAP